MLRTGIAIPAILGLALLAAPARTGGSADVRRRVEVSTDEPKARHVESILAINPRDPRNLVAASMVLGAGESCAVYASRDSGVTWTRATHGRAGSARFDGLDPAVAFDRQGNAYFLSLGSRLVVWRSTDGGFTWGEGAVIPGTSWDRPWIASDPGGPGRPERVIVAGKIPVTVFGHIASDIVAVSVSNDAGRAFDFPRLYLPPPETQLLNVVSDLLVAADGNILLTLQLFPPEVVRDELLTGWYATVVSKDGGRTFSAPRLGPEFRVYGHAREGKSLFALGGARMSVDSSGGPRNGGIYLVWLDTVDGLYRVFAAASTDGGASWSEPVRVSDTRSDTDASTPSIAVDGAGIVGVSWYDRRTDPSNGCYQTYFAASADGARTFSANQLVDATPTCPLARGAAVAGPPPKGEDPVASDYRFKNGGDTQGIVGLPEAEGGFHLAWIQAGANEMQLWSAMVRVGPPALQPR